MVDMIIKFRPRIIFQGACFSFFDNFLSRNKKVHAYIASIQTMAQFTFSSTIKNSSRIALLVYN